MAKLKSILPKDKELELRVIQQKIINKKMLNEDYSELQEQEQEIVNLVGVEE